MRCRTLKIEASTLTTCTVVDGGDRLSLGLVDADGRPVELNVSVTDGCAIAMTLPRLLSTALKQKFRDDSLRYVFPLDTWQVETVQDGSQIIMTLATGGGFEVSFATRPDACRSFGSALRDSSVSPALEAPLAN